MRTLSYVPACYLILDINAIPSRTSSHLRAHVLTIQFQQRNATLLRHHHRWVPSVSGLVGWERKNELLSLITSLENGHSGPIDRTKSAQIVGRFRFIDSPGRNILERKISLRYFQRFTSTMANSVRPHAMQENKICTFKLGAFVWHIIGYKGVCIGRMLLWRHVWTFMHFAHILCGKITIVLGVLLNCA